MRDSEKLADIKQARRELLQPPKKHTLSIDNSTAPSPFSVLPSRVFADARVQNASIRVLGTICCHANQHSGIVFTNQITIANRLGITKQAVSRQMRLLEKCGYIKKIYKENPLRKKGRKGATWRILYDPATTDEDIIAHNKPDFVAEQDAEDTLKVIAKSQPSVDKVNEQSKRDVDYTSKKVNSQVDHNYSSISSNKDFREIAMQICKVYAREREERLGAMLGWRNDERQIAIVEKYLGQGHDKNVLLETFLGSLNHFKETGKRPPFSLAYYDKYFNKQEKESVNDILKRTINRSRFNSVRKPR
jgi:DNA-binding Lrp family transcriptional regulator|tara:strand:+ start:175 stop:1086 length:912 start_codon:yes stop_codon:yes gene_type:complete